MKPALHKQRGMTLIVALIMLVLITLLVVSGLNMNQSSLQTVGNMQQRNDAAAAADEVIEQTLSSDRFVTTPENAFPDPCDGVANKKCIDVNGDGKRDIEVVLSPKPACIMTAVATPRLEKSDGSLDTGNSSCAVGADSADLSRETGQSTSSCYDTTWEFIATATDTVTQAKITEVAGVSARVSSDAVITSCP